MNKLVIVLVLLIVVVYARYYLRANQEFQIIQASLTKVKPNHLFEKSPIVIEEPMVDPKLLLKTLFKYLYTFKRIGTPKQNVLIQNKCKYMIIWPTQREAEVQIMHPKEKNREKALHLDVKLKRNQCVILPLHWWYKTDSEMFAKIDLDDLISIILGKF